MPNLMAQIAGRFQTQPFARQHEVYRHKHQPCKQKFSQPALRRADGRGTMASTSGLSLLSMWNPQIRGYADAMPRLSLWARSVWLRYSRL